MMFQKKNLFLPFALVPVLALAVGATPPGGCGDEDDEIELDEAEVFIEYNSTDGDFGIQFFWDGEPWRKMKVERPDGKAVLKVRAGRNLAAQGLTEGFFESAEPPEDELSMEEFFERFPEGEYEFEGRANSGDELEGETEFTHVLPSPIEGLCPADGDEVDSSQPLVLRFDEVDEDIDGEPLSPELYEVIVETEDDLLRIFSIILDGDCDDPQVTLPPEFLKPDGEYKFEVIVQEESGNRTITEIEFTTY